MTPDLELETWREEWQAGTQVPDGLRRKVARGSRNMRIMLALEVLVTVSIGGGSIAWAAIEPRTEMLVLVLAVWIFLAAAWSFAIVSRRGSWSPTALTTSDYIQLSIRRCHARIAGTVFGTVLYFAEMTFCLIWLYRDPARRVPLPAIVYGVVTPIFLVGVARFRRRVLAELDSLRQLQNQERVTQSLLI